jgi:hypothetical protein
VDELVDYKPPVRKAPNPYAEAPVH